MKLSAKAEYACVAMVGLAARHKEGVPVSIKALAEPFGISTAFLLQIFLQLKGAGLAASSRGMGGGYQLSRAPAKITLAEIIDVIDGPGAGESALGDLKESGVVTALHAVWEDAQRAERRVLESVTLADVLQQAQEGDALFYHI
jgi:Rrf2 family protein